MLEGEHRLDEPGHAGGGVEMPDVRLQCTDRAKSVALGARAKRTRESGYLDWIPNGGAGPMSFDV